MNDHLRVVIRNKTAVLLDRECLSISMVNILGPFDILPGHTNFVSLIGGDVVVRDSSPRVWRRSCQKGIVRVSSNLVDIVFLEES